MKALASEPHGLVVTRTPSQMSGRDDAAVRASRAATDDARVSHCIASSHESSG